MCSIAGCAKRVKCKGLCDTHYAAQRRASSDQAAESHREQSKAHYHRNKDTIQQRRKDVYDPVKRRAHNRAYYEENSAKLIQGAKDYAAANPEAARRNTTRSSATNTTC